MSSADSWLRAGTVAAAIALVALFTFPFVAHEWLSPVTLYFLLHLIGHAGLVFVKGLLGRPMQAARFE